MNCSKVLVDDVGSGGGSVGVDDLSSIGTLVAVKAGNGILDLVTDGLVVVRSAGETRGLVVGGLAERLVLVGLEVSVDGCQMALDDGE